MLTAVATVTRRLEFDAAHRVLGHEGKCKNLHGHRYAVEFTVSGSLDDVGRVIDFGVVKQLLGNWIDEHLDHNVLLHQDDPLLVHKEDFGREPWVMPCNPTAENIAAMLFRMAIAVLPGKLLVQNVRIYETPNCWADCGRLKV